MSDQMIEQGRVNRLREIVFRIQEHEEKMKALKSIQLEPGFRGHKAMLELLDQPSVAAFAALPKEARFEKWEELFGECDGSFLDEVNHFDFLHSFKVLDRHIGHGPMERRLVQEARHFFYERTELVFPAEWIEKFLADQLGQWNDAVPVENLAQRVVVRVDRRRVKGSEITRYLRHLLKFTNVESLKVEIWAKGALDGSDFETQDTVRRMAGVIQELIDKFGDCISIWKIRLEDWETHCGHDNFVGEPFNITAWWDKPPEESWAGLGQGTSSFQELMQDQIASWGNQLDDNEELWD